jgi:molybdopterin molybdotransferase
MIKVAAALRIVLEGMKILDSEAIKLTDALGRVLAEDIHSDSDIPGFDNSAMDGYAVKSVDLKGASKNNPKVLEVIGDLKAGDMPKKALKEHQAIRIMTGAPIPKGADSVVMVEETRKIRNDTVEIFKEVEKGENVRRAGEDIRKGELVLRRGLPLKPAHIGIMASLGMVKVKVSRKPKVAVLATGDEVVDVGKKLKPGKIRSSNSYTLISQISQCGGTPKNLGIVGDNPRQLENKLRTGMDCDVILTSGGVSVGDYDLVKDILAKMGTSIRFWKVAMRPGKPLVFGTIRGIPVFGLPGNPVSSMVSFEIFVRPAILKMSGQKDGLHQEAEAVLERAIEKKKGLRYFVRANTRWQQGKLVTAATGPQGSGILKSMALANSLIILPEDDEHIEKGKRVTVRFLNY